MKIAVASENKCVSGHFGHCEGFEIYDIDNNSIVKKEFVANPGHRPGFLPVFLKDLNVNIIISGGMGETAQQLFVDNNINVIVGAMGSTDDIVNKYIGGTLVSSGSVCREHMHEGRCNE